MSFVIIDKEKLVERMVADWEMPAEFVREAIEELATPQSGQGTKAPIDGAVAQDKPDLIARGMSWVDAEALMREACAQAGVTWDDDKQPQDIAINVMQRLANAAHKAGFKLALARSALAARSTDGAVAQREGVTGTSLKALVSAYGDACFWKGVEDDKPHLEKVLALQKQVVESIDALAARSGEGAVPDLSDAQLVAIFKKWNEINDEGIFDLMRRAIRAAAPSTGSTKP